MSIQTFTNWVTLPENRSAQDAAERVAEAICAGRTRRDVNPLFLHGPAGTGKTHLTSALATAVGERAPDRVVSLIAARDFGLPHTDDEDNAELAATHQGDLTIVEDVQHLPERGAEAVIQLLDRCQARGQYLVFTAPAGPAQLTHLPARLTSRLAGGLVVGLQTLSPTSRRTLLERLIGQRSLAVDTVVLDWVAENVPGSARQLEGAITRLGTLLGMHNGTADVRTVAEYFQTDAEAHRPTVERIAQRVGRYFRIEPRQMQSRRRTRNTLLPRQVGMYLARQLTELSLQQIGAYFGGRDHSTVLHACRKVAQALESDVALSGAVRQLHADLA
jgi:chromosomal replication initiator protein